MDKRIKTILSVVLAALLLLGAAPLTAWDLSLPGIDLAAPTAEAADYLTSGYCGDTANGGDGTNIAWAIDENGVLTLTGSGVMGSAPNREDNRIKKLTVGEGITRLADYAFAYCQNLEEITLPSTLEATGDHTFSNDDALTAIDLGGVREIGQRAFYACAALSRVEFPGTVTAIGQEAFGICENLCEIVFHEGLKEIGPAAFASTFKRQGYYDAEGRWFAYGPERYRPVRFPDSLETIGEGAFRYAFHLPEIDLGGGVQAVGANAFYGCTGLTGTVAFPDPCAAVGADAFYETAVSAFEIGAGMTDFASSVGMTSLTRIDVSEENGVYASYDGVMYTKGYTSLVQVPAVEVLNLPAAFPLQTKNSGRPYYEDLPYNFLVGWSTLSCVNVDEANEDYRSVGGVVYTKDGSLLVACPQAFAGGVTVADGTRRIGERAFYFCTKLTAAEIPGTVTAIGQEAFGICENLCEIVFHEGLKEIGPAAFASTFKRQGYYDGEGRWFAYGPERYRPVRFPDSLETIREGAFRYAIHLSEIDLGDGVRTLERDVFSNCTDLRTVRLSGALESWDLGNAGFNAIASLTVPNRYTELKNYGDVTVPASGGTVCGYCGSPAHEMAIKRLYTWESLGHAWLDWYTVTPADFGHGGIERRDCAYCDGYEERVTPKLETETYTATFVADGTVVASVDFQKGTTSINEPAVPARDRYTGRWEDYTLADADLTVNAVYTLIQSGDVSEIKTDSTVTHYTEKDNVLFRLRAYSDAKTVKSIVSQTVPLDIVLVVDQSGSMDETLGGSVKKTEALKAVANEFIAAVAANAEMTGAQHRIAIVGFGLAGNHSGYQYNENTGLLASPRGAVSFEDITPADYAGALIGVGDRQTLLNAVAAIGARGATAADLGFEMAKGVFANTDAAGRERVVIFMTDGEPTYTNGFQTSVANAAVYNAYLLKNAYDALVYSVGVFGDAEANNNKVRSFMNAVSSNYPNARTYNGLGAAVSDAFFITASHTDALSGIFRTITTEALSHTAPFDRVTLIKTLSPYVTLTSRQEEALRVDVMRRYGIPNENIHVTVDEQSRTEIRIDGLTPYETTDAEGNVRYEVSVEFFAALNEKAATAGVYAVDTEDGGIMLNGAVGYEATFPTGEITLTSGKNRYIFTVNGEVYEIAEGGSISACVPETDFAADWQFSGWDLTGVQSVNGVIVDASLVKAPRTVTWRTADGDVPQVYVQGDILTPPQVADRADGSVFLSWDRSLPTVMPDRDLEFTAVYGPHIHRYVSALTVKATCTADGLLTFTCVCGDTYTETVPATGHNYEALTASTDNDGARCTFVCLNCGDRYDYALNYQVVSAGGRRGRILYEFDLTDDGLETGFQPDGSVTVRVPLSDFQSAAHRVTVRRLVDGVWEDVPAAIEDGYLVITADHFTPYDVRFTFPCEETGEHDWGEGEITLAPTCSAEGNRHYVCSLCEGEKDEPIKRDPDAHVFRVTVTEPTCTEGGYTSHACTLCRYGYADEETDPLGHIFALRVTPPTCTEGGYTTCTCTRCRYSFVKDPTPAAGHTDKNGDGSCDICGAPIQEALQSNCVCGRYHTGPFAGLIIFFHRIAYFFRNLFR